MKKPGYYVAKVLISATRTNLKLESRCFEVCDLQTEDDARKRADDWRDFLSSEDPKGSYQIIRVYS